MKRKRGESDGLVQKPTRTCVGFCVDVACMMKNISWIGLGNMGRPMAANLTRKGYILTAYNRTAMTLTDDSNLVRTSKEALVDADVVFLMLSDGPAVEEILFTEDIDGACGIRHLKPKTLIINMSTVGLDETYAYAKRAEAMGHVWLEAPVIGSIQPAIDGTLFILASGPATEFESVLPLLEAMGNRIKYLGETGRATAMKLVVNLYLGMTMQTLGECVTISDGLAFRRDMLFDVLAHTSVWSPVANGKQKMYMEDMYPPSFPIKHMAKDLQLAARMSESVAVPIPSGQTVLSTFEDAHVEYGELDMAGIVKYLGRSAGQS